MAIPGRRGADRNNSSELEALGLAEIERAVGQLRRLSADGTTAPTGPPVRIGTATICSDEPVDLSVNEPVLLSLLGEETIAIGGPTDESDVLLVGAVLRQLGTIAPGGLAVDWFDPLVFSPLKALDLRQDGSDDTQLSKAEDLFDHLVEQRAEIEATLALGTTSAPQQQRLLVMHDFPIGLDQRCFDEVRWLSEFGPDAGVHLLLQLNDDAEGALVQETDELIASSLLIEVAKNRIRIDGLDALELVPDPPLSPTALNSIRERLGGRPSSGTRPRLDPDLSSRGQDPVQMEEISHTTILRAEQALRLSAAEMSIAQAQSLVYIPRALTVALLLVAVLSTLEPAALLIGSLLGLLAGVVLLLSRSDRR